MIHQAFDVFGKLVKGVTPHRRIGFAVPAQIDGDDAISIRKPSDLRIPRATVQRKRVKKHDGHSVPFIRIGQVNTVDVYFHQELPCLPSFPHPCCHSHTSPSLPPPCCHSCIPPVLPAPLLSFPQVSSGNPSDSFCAYPYDARQRRLDSRLQTSGMTASPSLPPPAVLPAPYAALGRAP